MFAESEVEQYSVSSDSVRIELMTCELWLLKYDVLPIKLCYCQGLGSEGYMSISLSIS